MIGKECGKKRHGVIFLTLGNPNYCYVFQQSVPNYFSKLFLIFKNENKTIANRLYVVMNRKPLLHN